MDKCVIQKISVSFTKLNAFKCWHFSLFLMPRRYRRRNFGNKDKYSIEHTIIRTAPTDQWTQITGEGSVNTSFQTYHTVVSGADFEGMRKVKHITITASNGSPTQSPLYYVVAYVPQGYAPQEIKMPIPGVSLSTYEANQFVMSCGWLDFDGGPLRIRTPLSRNLNSGDDIVLILASYSQSNSIYYIFDVTYAITLQ